MEQRILSIDSQILNSIQSCPRKTQLQFVQLVQPSEKAEALERGDFLHQLLEIYDSLRWDCANVKSNVWKMLGGPPIPGQMSHDDSRQVALDSAPLIASAMTLPMEEVEEVTYQFKEYVNHFENDGWRAIAVERVGARVLYEDDDLKVIYNFKIDKIAEHGNLRLPWDHKSAKRRTTPSSLSNQFIGYCWGLGMDSLMVNKIGFQKTLKPSERFERVILSYSPSRIQEWVNNSIYWAQHLDSMSIHKNPWPMNWTSCDKYSGCIYAPICESSPEGREWKIERDYKIGEEWDVARVLEAR